MNVLIQALWCTWAHMSIGYGVSWLLLQNKISQNVAAKIKKHFTPQFVGQESVKVLTGMLLTQDLSGGDSQPPVFSQGCVSSEGSTEGQSLPSSGMWLLAVPGPHDMGLCTGCLKALETC